MSLKVGDKVRIIEGGLGISPQQKGETTVITEVGGIYTGGSDTYGPMPGVKAKNIYNPAYNDWVAERSFELISRNVWKGGKR